MRATLASAILLAAATAGCGNYSNDDIAFFDALPNSAALSVKVPETNANALSSDAALHQLTVVAAENVNAGLETVLSLLDLIQALPPSQRTPDSRTWGPFDDHSHPGFEIEVVLTRMTSGPYDFAFSERKKGSGQTFAPIITGTFFAQSAHLGHGTLHLDTSAQAQIGVDGGDPNLSSLDVVYANDQTPRTVTTTIVGTNSTNASPASTTYAFEEEQDASGRLVFDVSADFAANGYDEDLHLVSVWRADGAGRSDGEMSHGYIDVVLGDGGSDRFAECWNAQFGETYFDSEFYAAPDGGPMAPGIDCDADAGHPSGCPDGNAVACVLPAAWP